LAGFWKRWAPRAQRECAPSAEDLRLAGLLAEHRIDHVLDVGANIGQYAGKLRAAGYRGRITSFEPLSQAHAALVARAAADPAWTVALPLALASTKGRATMRVSNRSDMSSLRPMAPLTLAALPKSFEIGREEVQSERLDAVLDRFVGSADVLFLKIDAQGSEAEILEGAAGVLDRLAGVQVEMSLRPMYEGEATYLTLCRWLEERGFEPFWFTGGNFSKRLGRQLQMDGIFFRAPGKARPATASAGS
jgi:FkbM family methyltransferase